MRCGLGWNKINLNGGTNSGNQSRYISTLGSTANAILVDNLDGAIYANKKL